MVVFCQKRAFCTAVYRMMHGRACNRSNGMEQKCTVSGTKMHGLWRRPCNGLINEWRVTYNPPIKWQGSTWVLHESVYYIVLQFHLLTNVLDVGKMLDNVNEGLRSSPSTRGEKMLLCYECQTTDMQVTRLLTWFLPHEEKQITLYQRERHRWSQIKSKN